MRKLLLSLTPLPAFLTFALLTFAPEAAAAATAPRQAPEFVIQETNGHQLLLSSYRGKPVVLALMYATCSHCQHTAGLLNEISKEYAPKGVQVLGATFGNGDAMRIDAFVKQLQIAFPCGYSNIPAVLSFLNLPQDTPYFVPILVFIDKKGNIERQIIGDDKFLAEKDQPSNIRAEIDKLLKTPPIPSTSMKSKKTPRS